MPLEFDMLPLFKFALFLQKKEFGPPPKEVLENNVTISFDRWVDTRTGEEFELNDFVGDSVDSYCAGSEPTVASAQWISKHSCLPPSPEG